MACRESSMWTHVQQYRSTHTQLYTRTYTYRFRSGHTCIAVYEDTNIADAHLGSKHAKV
jgi:hypothetical protein